MITAIALVVGSFLAMELVSYSGHRWVMHGPGMGWHRSHHTPSAGRFERNDLFPVCFSVVGFGLFLAASLGLASWLWWVAIGVTAYGAAYLVVHEVYIHHRLRAPRSGGRYLSWLREAHADHHRGAGEPYGMLLPLVRGTPRGRSDRGDDVLDRSEARRSTRAERSRL